MKKEHILVVLSILIVFFIFPNFVSATITGKVNDRDGINIRDNYSVNSNIIGKISYNGSITLVDKTIFTGNGCSNGWYKILYNTGYGYVCSDYVTINEESDTTNVSYNTSTYSVRTNDYGISVRSGAGTGYTRIDSLIYGTNLNVISTSPSGNGCSDPWYYVSYHNGKKGYVCSTYTYKKEDITVSEENFTDEEKEYANNLKLAGFPDSYIPYLMYIHRNHPNWVFEADNANLTWDRVISSESGKNYTQSTLENYRKNDILMEAGGWYTASDALNAFFIDPRNFLMESHIFMFEKIIYDEANQTRDVMKALAGSSYLSNDYYINIFMDAASRYKVSPVHLLSRIIQEGGSKEDYTPITGTSTYYYGPYYLYGYYNYYNIGAYGDSVTSNPVIRGLAYACGPACGFGSSYGRPWTSREAAILGGANFIAENYVYSGQFTIYFQKFNTSSKSTSLFAGQYMTNVHAPSTEGLNTYNSYKKNNILNNTYVFTIPVYLNMPDSTSLPIIGNTDNSLSSIKVNGNLINTFDSDVLTYTYYVDKNVNSVDLTATPTISTSSISGTGKINLNSDTVSVNIIVTSETGDSKTYNITFIKVDGVQTINDIISNLKVKVDGNYFKSISAGTNASNLINTINKLDPGATIVLKDANNNAISTSSDLATGQTITITTSSKETSTFKIVVTGDASGDGQITILDLLKVQKHLLKSSTLTDAYLYASDTNSDNDVTILDLLRIQKHILGDITL